MIKSSALSFDVEIALDSLFWHVLVWTVLIKMVNKPKLVVQKAHSPTPSPSLVSSCVSIEHLGSTTEEDDIS